MKTFVYLLKKFVAFSFCIVVLPSLAKGEELPWKAGTASTIITPVEKVWLAGYGYKREPTGILHDIWAKALALEDMDGNRCVVVTSDLMGIPRSMYESISAKLKNRFHLNQSQILLTFSHNHCGPRLHEDLVDYYPIDNAQTELVRRYSETLEEKIIETIARAFSGLSPARLSIGEGRATFAVNRRNNPESDVPELRKAGIPLKGPVDHTVPVLAVHGANDRLFAVLFGYACHPTTLNFTQWCGDYPGFAQLALEEKHPGTTALFFTACGADQNPLPRRELVLCQQYGSRLAEAVEKTLSDELKPVPSVIRTAFTYVGLDYDSQPTRKELEDAMSVYDRDTSARARIHASWAGRMLDQLDAGEPFATSYPYPVQVWKLGGVLLWINLGAEAVVDYSLRFKKDFGSYTWVGGYAHVLIAYIPSRRVYEEGGYEGGAFLYEYGLPAYRWADGVEGRVVDAVLRLVEEVR